MAVVQLGQGQKQQYMGASTDTKPTEATHQTKAFATFYEHDTGIMYITYDGTNWVEKDTVVRLETSPTIDIGDVTLLAGTAVVGKVRPVTATGDEVTDDTADAVKVIQVDSYGVFANGVGQPEIRCDNEGWGQWENKALQAKFKDSHDINRHFRYGNWAVHLNGGPQASEESWAAISIPVKEMKVSDITSISYDWYAQYNGSAHILDIGPNLVFSAYDPDNHAARVDFNTYAIDNNIYMADGLANRPIEAGWYKYIMTSTDATEKVFWYGNNTGSHDTAPAEGADGYWSQYIVDTVFKDWVVYRIQIQFGYWGSTRSTGDVWIDAPKINGIPIKWEPSEAEKILIAEKEAKTFGKPTLVSANYGKAEWVLGSQIDSTYQKSPSGWLAYLYGGVQTNDDYAAMNIPVDNLPVPNLKTALWSYYMSAAEAFGVNMVIWVHDPFDPDNRAEITQRQQHANLAKGAGWNSHVMNPSTDYWFYYGEGTTNTNLVAGTDYGWDDFVADEMFNTWRIYRISFEFGWSGPTKTFDPAYLADVILNGQQILLGPPSGKHKKTVLVTKTVVGGANAADDVISENASTGTDWDFNFGGTGKITKAIITCATNAIVPVTELQLYSAPPTCNLNDNVASTGPIAADIPYFMGVINLPAMTDSGTSQSFAIATPSLTTSNLPLDFDSSNLYGVLVDKTGATWGNVLVSIFLSADMSD